MLLPLLELPKEIFSGIDVTGPDGQSLHVLKRGENTLLSAVAGRLVSAPESVSAINRVDYNDDNADAVVANTQRLAMRSPNTLPHQHYDFVVELRVTKDEVHRAKRGDTLLSLIKVVYTRSWNDATFFPPVWTGSGIFGQAKFRHNFGSQGRGQHAQIKIDIPDGMSATRAAAYNRLTGVMYETEEQALKTTPGQVVANLRRILDLKPALQGADTVGVRHQDHQPDELVVRCRLSGRLVWPVVTALSLVFLLLVIFDVFMRRILEFDADARSSAITILLVAPALVSLYAAQPNEHYRVRSAVNFYRSLMLLSAGFLFIGATSLAVTSSEDNVLWDARFFNGRDLVLTVDTLFSFLTGASGVLAVGTLVSWVATLQGVRNVFVRGVRSLK